MKLFLSSYQFFFICIIVCCGIQSVLSIKCYKCESAINNMICGEHFNPTVENTEILDCDKIQMPEYLIKHYGENSKASGCMTVTTNNVQVNGYRAGKSIERYCYFGNINDNINGCKIALGAVGELYENVECKLCNEDLCNGY